MKEINKEELINDLIFYNGELDKLWEFHPDNLDKKNVQLEFNKLKLKITEIHDKIDKIDKK